MSLCASWVPEDEAADACACGDGVDVDVLIRWQLVASTILYALSGRQFPGVCSDTVRPCWCGTAGQSLAYVTSGGARPIVAGTCEAVGPCGGHASVLLPHRPVRSITEVVVDGVTLDPAEYGLVDRRWLVRAGRRSWPCCQDLGRADDEPGTWSVSYEYGVAPPAGGKEMAAMYGCELAKGCAGDSGCRLPRRVQTLTREGVSMTVIDPYEFLDQGRTGLYEIDAWLASVNPTGIDRAGKVINPDLLMTHRRR